MPFSFLPFKKNAPARSPTGQRTAGTLATRKVAPAGGGKTSRAAGRTGASAHSVTNAGSDVQVIQNYSFTALGATLTQPLPDDGDFNAAIFTVSVSAASASASTDILNYFATAGIEIVGPEGPIIDMTPVNDFYGFQQRFGEYGVAPTVVNLASGTVTVTASATYFVSGINLPKSKGPYTLVATINGTNPSSGALNSVQFSLALVLGECPDGNRTRYKATSLPFTPAANGVNDLGPVASIQDVNLQELFLYALTSNTADISFLQIQSQGSSVATRMTSSDIQARDTAKLSGTLAATRLYPLLALGTGLILGRSSHFYITWGSSPSTAIIAGYYWFD